MCGLAAVAALLAGAEGAQAAAADQAFTVANYPVEAAAEDAIRAKS
jgi:hypothetical protein